MSQTIRNWKEIEEATAKNNFEERRKDIFGIVGFWIKGLILTAAFLVIMGAVGNAVEFIARM